MKVQLHNLLAEIISDNLSIYFVRQELQELHEGACDLKPGEIEAVQKIINIGMRIAQQLEEDNPAKFNQKIFREKSQIDRALDIAVQKTAVKT
ncbi:unnamed protein product [marine sediment metagenome]|uniref:Uncharacterized protein n=1 Tax=marine sediment metagenome TaxID=412755 RepID=X0TSC6_9ZZZZ